MKLSQLFEHWTSFINDDKYLAALFIVMTMIQLKVSSNIDQLGIMNVFGTDDKTRQLLLDMNINNASTIYKNNEFRKCNTSEIEDVRYMISKFFKEMESKNGKAYIPSIFLQKLSNDQMARGDIYFAVEILINRKHSSWLNRCIQKYGSKFVWQVEGDRLRKLGLKEEDLPVNDREFLGEEHDMEN